MTKYILKYPAFKIGDNLYFVVLDYFEYYTLSTAHIMTVQYR